MKKRSRFVFSVYIYGFMIGLAVSCTMFGTVLPQMIEDYGLSFSQAGILPVFTSAGNMIAMLVTGILGDRYSKSILIGITVMGISAGLAMTGLAPSFFLLLFVMALLGMGSSMLNLLVTAFVSDVYGSDRSRHINLVHMFYGIGSLIGPLFPMLFLKSGFTWRYSYLFLSLLTAAAGAFYFVKVLKERESGLTGVERAEKEGGRVEKNENGCKIPKTDVSALFRDKRMIALAFMSFLYMGGHQNTFGTWFQTYLQSTDTQVYLEEFTSVCMTVYWIGMVVSRMAGASWPGKISPRRFILGGCAGGAAALGLGLVFSAPALWMMAAALLGVCTGVIYPLLFSISCGWFPAASAGVSSLVGIFTSAGSMLCGWMAGRIADTVSFSAAMFVPWVSLVIVFLIVFFYFPKEEV